MKKFGIIIFIVAILIGVGFSSLFSFGRVSGKIFNFSFGSRVQGSGVARTEVRDVGKFQGVDVSGIFEVEIISGKDFDVQVDADDNLLQYIKTEVDSGVLQISSTKRLKSDMPIRVRVSAPDINTIEGSGATSISLTGVKNSELKVDTSGASKVKLAGETTLLSVEVSGASKIDAQGLKAESASVDASGASNADIFVTGKLVSDASGASKIAYSGNPAIVEKNATGASKVYQK